MRTVEFLAPYTVRAKMALQEAWLRGLDWDEEFPDDLKASTRQWVEQFSEAPKVKISRCYRHDKEVEQVSLHTFVDASRLSYAAVIKLCQIQICEWSHFRHPSNSQSKSSTDQSCEHPAP